MKTLFPILIAALVAGAASAQQTDNSRTNNSSESSRPDSSSRTEFNFSEAADTVESIAAEAGQIDRKEYLDHLQKRSESILSELKPMVEELKRRTPEEVQTEVNDKTEPQQKLELSARPELATVPIAPLEGNQADSVKSGKKPAPAHDRQFQELSGRLDDLEQRVKAIESKLKERQLPAQPE